MENVLTDVTCGIEAVSSFPARFLSDHLRLGLAYDGVHLLPDEIVLCFISSVLE